MITPEMCKKAFWMAADATLADDQIHDMDKPYFDESMEMVDAAGCGMPGRFWTHLAEALEATT